jgi:hypothetical protein
LLMRQPPEFEFMVIYTPYEFSLQPFDSPFDEEGFVTLKQFDSGTF